MADKVNTVDAYIAQFPAERQELLEKIRSVIKDAAPEATEKISWQMPTYWQGENLVHFASAKNHIGFHPSPGAIVAFEEKLKVFKTSKGTVQFPVSKPIPYDLIAEITRFRVEQAKQKTQRGE